MTSLMKDKFGVLFCVTFGGCASLVLLLGDFNVVRSPEERKNSYFCMRAARDFNDFIHESDLYEYTMGAKSSRTF